MAEEKLPSWLKRKGNSILFNGDGTFNFYIPEKFFERNIAFFVEDSVSVLGILDYAIADKSGKMGQLHRFDYPTRFVTHPTKVNKLKNVKLIKESPTLDYRVLVYQKDDPIIVNTHVPEDINNVEDLLRLFFITGFIPNTIPYDEIQFTVLNNIAYSGNSYGVSLQIIGLMISEICRSHKDPNTAFRLSNDKDMKNYRSIRIDTLAKLTTPYSAITSENFNEAVVFSALNKGKNIDVPLERVLTGEEIL